MEDLEAESTLPMRPSTAPSSRETGPFLVLALECDRPLAGSSRHLLDGVDQVVLGRGARREAVRSRVEDLSVLTLRVPDRRMSSAHARITRTPHGWTFEDTGSMNGSSVDGEPTLSAALTDGDLIEVGATLFLFRTAGPTPSERTPDVTAAAEPGKVVTSTLVPGLAKGLAALGRIAASSVPVLLLGESGTGKEVHARAIHEWSGRPGMLVPVNCGALSENLVEAQLFGHRKGAFSGAVRDEEGFVRASSRGTLFLDEIGDLPAASQAALLRVLQEREVVPVGMSTAIPVDLRVISATHRDLDKLVRDGAFRHDLLARLSGYTHRLPPLRQRLEDLGTLIATLLPTLAGDRAGEVKLSPEVGRALFTHDWPLNVRELELCLRSMVVLAEDLVLLPEHLPESLRRSGRVGGSGEASPTSDAPTPRSSEDDERLRSSLVALLTTHKGNVSKVALAMGKARMQVQRWMKRLEIDPARFRH